MESSKTKYGPLIVFYMWHIPSVDWETNNGHGLGYLEGVFYFFGLVVGSLLYSWLLNFLVAFYLSIGFLCFTLEGLEECIAFSLGWICFCIVHLLL